jgi:hypothetical protein
MGFHSMKAKVMTNQLVIDVAELDILQIDAMQKLVFFKNFYKQKSCLKVSQVTSASHLDQDGSHQAPGTPWASSFQLRRS